MPLSDTGRKVLAGAIRKIVLRGGVVMPLSDTGRKVLAAMVKEYGRKKGQQVFYAKEHSQPGWRKQEKPPPIRR